MRPWLALVVMACGNDRGADHRDRTPLPAIESVRRSIDIAVAAGSPVAIRGVEATSRSDGSLEITYRVAATGAGPALVPTRMRCRIGERNLVYPDTAAGKVPGPRLTSVFRGEPFSGSPSTCEIAFLYASDEQAPPREVGVACFDGATLRDGRCPEASFPIPDLPTAGAVVLERTAIELRDASAVVTALFTLAQPLSEDRRFAATIACADRTGTVNGEAALTFVPLGILPVGASVFGPVMFALDRTPAADARCTFAVVSRTTLAGQGGDRIHAQYCVSSHSVRVGGC